MERTHPFKHPPSLTALDDLPNRLERLHLAGYFRAIGSSLDCLGAAVIGVLGLRRSLRYGDLGNAEKALRTVEPADDSATKLQAEFAKFFDETKQAAGPEDWLEWTNQYRNMFVHRGRRASYHEIVPRDYLFYDAQSRLIPRATSVTHLARYPDRSEIEGLIKGRELFLGESAESTLSGIFESCQRFEQEVCAEMVSIWNLRRLDPLLILQPIEQWRVKIKTNTFPGYEAREAFVPSELNLHESSAHRMKCAAVGDADRVEVWEGSPWTE